MHKLLLTLTLVLVFGTSAFVSVSGLSAVFSSAGIVIILMGCGMELGKILTVVHLHRRWKVLHWLSRGFYIMVIVALVLITSCEIMGYLSQNHVRGFLGLKSNHASLDALEQEEMILRDRIATIDNTLAGLPASYVTKRLRERENAGYEGLQVRLTEVINEKADIERQQITDKAYSAPIFATAKIFHIDEIRAASLFILFLVAVLEPLSIGLAVAVSIVWLSQYPVSQEIDRPDSHAVKSESTQKEDYVKTHVTQTDLPSIDVKLLQGDGEHSLVNETADPVVAAITHLVNIKGGFSGTVSELLEALNNTGYQDLVNRNGWPKAHHALGKRLKSLEQQLAGQGIYVTRSRTEESRKVEIGRAETIENI